MTTVVEHFLESLGASTSAAVWFRGLILPISWTLWSAVLIYHRVGVETVLPVLIGTLCMLTVIRSAQGRNSGG